MQATHARARTTAKWMMPPAFVLLWSTAFIGGKLVIPYAQPMTFLTLRYVGAFIILAGISSLTRAPWPRQWRAVGHAAVAGVLLHLVFIGGVFYAYLEGVDAGVAALIASLQPLLTAGAVGPLLGERVTRRQWVGLVLGLGGVLLVVWRKLALGIGSSLGVGLAVVALLGITYGTVYQKRFCADADLRTGNAVQFGVVAVVAGLLACAFETRPIEWSSEFIFALVWMTLVISVGAIALLFLMIRGGALAQVASVFYLVPPVTALIAWALFNETFGPIGLAGMGLTVLGVGLARRG